jgi:hypothetical protein
MYRVTSAEGNGGQEDMLGRRKEKGSAVVREGGAGWVLVLLQPMSLISVVGTG